MHVRIQGIPALALAAALQVLPIARVACVNQAVAPSGFAIVFRWFAGAVALLGTYHAVSGASAAIAGVQNLNPVGPLTTNATGAVGQAFAYRIVVTNPGVNPQQAFYNVSTLPPGLTINTNLGGNGYITGTPTTAGVYSPVTLTAGNANYPTVVTLDITIIITGSGGSPPQITGPPTNQTVQAGTNVAFNVTATGTSPLSYSWKFGSTVIAGATTSSLQLTNVQAANAGTYTVTVTNSAGSASASATLTVNAVATLPTITTQPQSLTVTNGDNASFSIVASGTAPLIYQWKFNGNKLDGAIATNYVVNNAQPANSGDYTVDVSNSAGAVTSSPAHLTVQGLPPSDFTIAAPQWTNSTWVLQVSGPAQTNYVLWRSGSLTTWTALRTNFSATGSVQFTDTNSASGLGFYRATLSP
jgi:hypothetical protein